MYLAGQLVGSVDETVGVCFPKAYKNSHHGCIIIEAEPAGSHEGKGGSILVQDDVVDGREGHTATQAGEGHHKEEI